jgi:cation transport ATPase
VKTLRNATEDGAAQGTQPDSGIETPVVEFSSSRRARRKRKRTRMREKKAPAHEKAMKPAFLAVASITLAVVMGSLAFRALSSLFPAIDFAANPVPGLITVGIFLLVSGFTYRRRFFATTRDCSLGVFAYVLLALVFAVYVTGADAFAGFMDSWIVWLVLVPLAPWFAGFFLARRGGYRFNKKAAKKA